MKKAKSAMPAPIDDYIARQPEAVREKLHQLRSAISKAAPGATEAIKYAIPTFILHENLVHFAAFKTHIGFYPTPSGIAQFQEDLSGYQTSKGAVQFPIDKRLPLALIRRIVKFRVQEATDRARAKETSRRGVRKPG